MPRRGFVVNGNSVANNAASVDDGIQRFRKLPKRLVLISWASASTFMAADSPPARVSACWLTRPDGVVYDSRSPDSFKVSTIVVVGADGTFSLLALSRTTKFGEQGEQPGLWFVSCRTFDGKVSGIAQFRVIGLPFVDP